MLAMPGHTPGHSALLVRLASGPVLLSGDQYHFTEAVKNRGVPSFNTDRADTLASHDRFERIAANLKPRSSSSTSLRTSPSCRLPAGGADK